MIHVVNRLRFEIRCPDEAQAFVIRANVAASLQEAAVEAIDSVCSRHTSEDEWLRVDTIEVDLGALSQNGLERNFAAEFRERFERELVKKLAASGSAVTLRPLVDRSFELFCHVLLYGVLPWWAAREEVVLDRLAMQLHAERAIDLREFLRANAKNAHLWLRASWQLEDAGRRAVIAAHEPLATLWALVEAALRRARRDTSDTWRQQAQHHDSVLASARQMVLTLVPELTGPAMDEALVARVVTAAIHAPSTAAVTMPTVRDIDVAAPADAQALREGAMPARASDSDSPLAVDSSAVAQRPLQEEVRVVVRHAGLVLLAPFFVRFFGECELLESGRWRNKHAQYTGIHLLKFLCTGMQRHAEHDLALEKLCCGVSLGEPVPRDLDLDARLLAEADALLTAVLTHWDALKRTSVQALRETFLQREGLVLQQEANWLLRIERKTVDVLIDRIPWGYSALAMPWNDYVIHVEW